MKHCGFEKIFCGVREVKAELIISKKENVFRVEGARTTLKLKGGEEVTEEAKLPYPFEFEDDIVSFAKEACNQILRKSVLTNGVSSFTNIELLQVVEVLKRNEKGVLNG